MANAKILKPKASRIFLSVVFVLNLAVTAVFWFLGSSDLIRSGKTAIELIALGRAAGLLAELFILTELVLVSRVPFVERAFGFDVLNRYHRRIGYGLLLGILSHPVLLVIGYAGLNGVPLLVQFLGFIKNWKGVAKALVGILVLVAAAFLSLPFIRRAVKYETWHVSHLLMYAAIALFFGHQVNTGDVSHGIAFYYWYATNFAVFGAMLVWRFIAPLIRFWRHRFIVDEIVPETHNVFSVYIAGRNMADFSFEPGQFVLVTFLAKGLIQPHPFSFSKAPDAGRIRISAKALGDYTSRIKDLKPGTPVIIEGPFGRFTESSASRDKYLFIAGGIGITPIKALLERIAKEKKDGVLLYANRTPDDIVFSRELEDLARTSSIRITHIMSDDPDFSGEQGRLDKEKISRLVPDAAFREAFVCGPPPMMDSIIRILKEIGVPAKNIHAERFSF